MSPTNQKTTKTPKTQAPTASKAPAAPKKQTAPVNKKAPSAPAKKPAPKKDTKTQAFNAVNKKKNNKKSQRTRKGIMIVILAVITILILALLGFIVYNMWSNNSKEPDVENVVPNMEVNYVPRDAGNVKMGNLLLINNSQRFDYALNNLVASSYENLPNGIVNLWTYKNDPENKLNTKIHISGDTYAPTYELSGNALANKICLEANTLESFNQMMLDYCATLDLSNYVSGSASKINVAWGWSYEEDLEQDVEKYSSTFLNHADGKTITLKQVKEGTEQVTLTESILKKDYKWIYENAHKYGFIIRYPNDCEDHTGYNSGTRLHLRYIGVEHATYIYENGICLEEYLELIRTKHTINNPLTFTAQGKEYQVYYFKYSGNPTSVPVPKDANYEISGDNMNGFIITVEK